MPLKVQKTEYQDLWGSSADLVNWLMYNMGEPIINYITFYVEEITFVTEDNAITLRPDAADVGSFDNANLILSEDPTTFQNYVVGDSIEIYDQALGTTVTKLITEKLSGSLIRVSGDFLAKVELSLDSYVALVTPFQGIKYFWNYIENNEPVNFQSKIDGETQLLYTNEADASNIAIVPMIFNGQKGYQYGSALIGGEGFTAGKQKFRMIHSCLLTPTFLAAQLEDVLAQIKPSYYLGGKCLKHAFRIEATRTANDPNPALVAQISNILGNTGWVGENYNGGNNYFSVNDLVLRRVSDNEIIPGIQIDEASEYNFFIDCISPAVFSNTQTKVYAAFCYLPESQEEYQNNGRDFKTNFVFDKSFDIVGGSVAQGDNFGDGIQVITQMECVFISSTRIAVRLRCELGSDAQTIMSQGDNKRYMLWVGTQSYDLDRATSDKAFMFVDINQLFEDLQDTDIINSETEFIPHPFEDETSGQNYLNAFPTDDVATSTIFNIDFAEGVPIKINQIRPGIVLKKPGELDINLDSVNINTSNSPLEGGLVPFISFSQDRVFKIPDGEIRKTIRVERRDDLDTGTLKYWQLIFPFMHRWEYWKALGVLNDLPEGILDVNEPHDGINHFWHRYTTVTGWAIYFRVRYVVEINGEQSEQVVDVPFSSFDYDSNPEWDNNSIDSFNSDDVELENGGTKYLLAYEDTKIVGTYEKVDGDLPDLADVEMVFWIEVAGVGGISDARRASSKYELSPDSWFKSIDTSNKIVKTNPSSGVYVATILLDYTKIPTDLEFTVYGRMYDPLSPVTPPDGLLYENGDNIPDEETGDFFIQE